VSQRWPGEASSVWSSTAVEGAFAWAVSRVLAGARPPLTAILAPARGAIVAEQLSAALPGTVAALAPASLRTVKNCGVCSRSYTFPVHVRSQSTWVTSGRVIGLSRTVFSVPV